MPAVQAIMSVFFDLPSVGNPGAGPGGGRGGKDPEDASGISMEFYGPTIKLSPACVPIS